jgi:hypothetical protein
MPTGVVNFLATYNIMSREISVEMDAVADVVLRMNERF